MHFVKIKKLWACIYEYAGRKYFKKYNFKEKKSHKKVSNIENLLKFYLPTCRLLVHGKPTKVFMVNLGTLLI